MTSTKSGVEVTTTMRRLLVLSTCLFAVALTGCAKMPKATPIFMSAQPTAVVLATAIIAPDALVSVVADAVAASPELAVSIAAAAAVAAPDQAPAIRATVLRLAPADAEAIVAVTKVKRRGPVIARVEIPDHDRLSALIERVTR